MSIFEENSLDVFQEVHDDLMRTRAILSLVLGTGIGLGMRLVAYAHQYGGPVEVSVVNIAQCVGASLMVWLLLTQKGRGARYKEGKRLLFHTALAADFGLRDYLGRHSEESSGEDDDR